MAPAFLGGNFIPEIPIVAAFLLRKPGARGMTLLSPPMLSTLHLPFSSGKNSSWPSFGWDEPSYGAQRQEKLFSEESGEEDVAVAPGAGQGSGRGARQYSKTSLPSKGNKSCAVPPAADLSLWNSGP